MQSSCCQGPESSLEIFGLNAHSIPASLCSDPRHIQVQGHVHLPLRFLLLLPGHLLSIPNLHAFVRMPSAESSGIDGRAVGTLVAPRTSGAAGVALMLPIPFSALYHLLWLLQVAEGVAQFLKRAESALLTSRETSHGQTSAPSRPQAHPCTHCRGKKDTTISQWLQPRPSSHLPVTQSPQNSQSNI